MRTSSMRPENHSSQIELPPMRSAPSETSIESSNGLLATGAPLTYSLSFEPSYVTARYVHVPAVSEPGPATFCSPRICAWPTGRPSALFAYSEYSIPVGCSLKTTVRQVEPSASGCTQASTVMPSVRSSDPEPGIATELDVPLNDSAEPYFPDTQLVLDVAPLLARPEESCTFAPLPSSKPC